MNQFILAPSNNNLPPSNSTIPLVNKTPLSNFPAPPNILATNNNNNQNHLKRWMLLNKCFPVLSCTRQLCRSKTSLLLLWTNNDFPIGNTTNELPPSNNNFNPSGAAIFPSNQPGAFQQVNKQTSTSFDDFQLKIWYLTATVISQDQGYILSTMYNVPFRNWMFVFTNLNSLPLTVFKKLTK